MTHTLSFWPQYHALPNPPAGFLRGLFAAGILAITFLLWGYLSSHFFTAPICTAFPASFSVVLLFLIGFRYWPLCFVAQILLLLTQDSSVPNKALLLAAVYIDFFFICRCFNRFYAKRLTNIDTAALFKQLKPCLFSFILVMLSVWWANIPNWPNPNAGIHAWQLLALLFLLGALERILSFSLLYGFIQQKTRAHISSNILPIALLAFLYTMGLRFWLQDSPIWLYALFLLIPALSVPFWASMLSTIWSSLAGILGILTALSLYPLGAALGSQANHNLTTILMLSALLQNGLAILRSSFFSLRAQEQRINQHTRQHYTNKLEHLPIGVFTLREIKPGQYRFEYLNSVFTQIVGMSANTIKNNPQNLLKILHDKRNTALLTQIRQAFEEDQVFCLEEKIYRHGKTRWVRLEFSTSRAANGARLANGVLIDISREKEQSLRLSISDTVLSEIHQGLLILDEHLTIRYCNPATSTLTGYSQEEILNQPLEGFMSAHTSQLNPDAQIWQALTENNNWQGEITFYTHDQSKKHLQVFLSMVHSPATDSRHYIVMLSDITPFKAREEQLVQLAYFDALTGLATRHLLYDRLNQAIGYTARNKLLLAVCYIDLDDFKEVNDQYGHGAGDQLLAEFGQRIRDELRRNDTAARIGGDEILLVLPNQKKRQNALRAIERIIASTTQPYQVLGRYQVHVTASIGVHFYDGSNTASSVPPTAVELIEKADQAMYRDKKQGTQQAFSDHLNTEK